MIRNIEVLFEQYSQEFLAFDRVKKKLSQRPDLHAFLLLDQLVPGHEGMVLAAEHDELALSIKLEELAEVASPADIRDLVRCGVRCDGDGLAFYA